MEENPLDLEVHEEDSLWDVWKRRIMFFVLIALCVTFAAPSFGSCTGAFEGPQGRLVAQYTANGKNVEIRESEIAKVKTRLYYARDFVRQNAPRSQAYFFMFPMTQQIEDDDVYEHLLLDRAAKDAGIRVPIAEVGRRLMKDIAQLDKNGEFDATQYELLVSRLGGGATHVEITRTLQEMFRKQEYERLLFGESGFELRFMGGVTATEDAFQEWRKENERVTVDYVVQPYDEVRKEFADKKPSAEELKKFIGDKAKYRVPAGKTVEMAYVRATEVTDQQFAKMKDFVFEAEILEEDPDPEVSRDDTLLATYWPTFWSAYSKKITFTRDQWIEHQREKAGYELAMEAYTAAKKAYDDAPEDAKPEEPVKPEDPGDAAWAVDTQASEVLRNFWAGQVGREVLGGLIVAHLAERAEREQKSFAAILPDYAPMGVQHAVNKTALQNNQFSEQYPDDLMKDNEGAVTVAARLPGPRGDATFTPQIHTEAVPLTQLEGRIADRGSFVLRLSAFEKSRPKNPAEIEGEATADWRAYQVTKRSKEKLDQVRKAVVDNGETLEAAAQSVGLSVRRVAEFNKETSRRTPPVVPDEGPEVEALRRVADTIGYERFVMDRYDELRRLAPGEFLKIGVLLDEQSEAGYLIQLASKRFPERIEVNEVNLGTARQSVAMKARERVDQVLGLEALKKRFKLDILPEPEETTDAEKEETAEGAGEGTGEGS